MTEQLDDTGPSVLLACLRQMLGRQTRLKATAVIQGITGLAGKQYKHVLRKPVFAGVQGLPLLAWADPGRARNDEIHGIFWPDQ
jgi:hypothetical protein